MRIFIAFIKPVPPPIRSRPIWPAGREGAAPYSLIVAVVLRRGQRIIPARAVDTWPPLHDTYTLATGNNIAECYRAFLSRRSSSKAFDRPYSKLTDTVANCSLTSYQICCGIAIARPLLRGSSLVCNAA